MMFLQCLLVLIPALCCHAAPAEADRPPDYCGPPERYEDREPIGTWDKPHYAPGTKLGYTCRPGFSRSGPIQFVCTEGKWETLGTPGHCRKKTCRSPGDIEFGSFELIKGDTFEFGAIVEYKCDEGYKMVSRHKTRECAATGWTNSPPICEVKQCPPIVVQDNVNILYTSNDEEHTVGQVVRFQCKNANEKLNGVSEIFCKTDGEWNDKPPTCNEIACSLPVIDHGKPKTGSRRNFASKESIEYECDIGYKPSRTPQITCTAAGWTPAPMCNEIYCYPEKVPRGQIKNAKMVYRYGETAILECEDGYLPQGNPDEPRKCTAYGWSPGLWCRSVQCPRPEIPNGAISEPWPGLYFPMNVGKSFYFYCDQGYSHPNKDRYGYVQTFCTREGWSPKPICRKQCPIPSASDMNAKIDRRQSAYYDGDKLTFNCNNGYRTQDGRNEGELQCINGKFTSEKCFNFCPKPDIKNGFIDTAETKFEVGSSVVYSCDEGYISENKLFKDISDCTNADWKPKPQCTEISCEVNNRAFKSGDVVHFKCREGDELIGEDSSQCYYYGWDPKVPDCKGRSARLYKPLIDDEMPESKCPATPSLPNAEVKLLDKDTFEIVCNFNHILDGSAEISCQNGKWQSPPMCIQKKLCSKPPQTANGEIIAEETSYYTGSTIKYRCNEGYHTTSSDTNTCVNGRWSKPPTCEEKSCGKPEQIENGKVTFEMTSYKPGEHATYECSRGYTQSRDFAICSKGKWHSVPECIDTSCGRPPKVLNGEVMGEIQEKYFTGQSVQYQCVSGYSIKDNINYVTCKDSHWTETPVCRRIGQSCGMPPTVNFGDTVEKRKLEYPSGSFITYVCINYYTLEGKDKIQCKDGEWEKEPVCREPCTAKEADMAKNNIRLRYKDDKKLYSTHLDWIEFICLPGYTIYGEKPLRIQCLDGKLDYPKCLKFGSCVLNQQKMAENNIRTSNSDIVENGNSITFECAEGIPEKSLETKCKDSQIEYPKCISSRPCTAPQILNVKINPEKKEYSSGFSADIDCQEPYVINGPRTITCNNGQWSELPECLSACKISTESLNEKNLELESKEDLSKTYKHDAEVNVKCKENFRRPRHPKSICNNGEMKSDKCFSGGVCRIEQEKLDSNFLELDESHNYDVYYGENEKVYFKCKNGSGHPTGNCAKSANSPALELTYPTCPSA